MFAFHDLRRTLGSWLAASGYRVPLIGRALNHTNVSTTSVFARLSLDPVREALEKNAALMRDHPPAINQPSAQSLLTASGASISRLSGATLPSVTSNQLRVSL